MQSTEEVRDGLEGVVAFATEIAEPDRNGGALRYRGVDLEELVGEAPFERVWGLLVDGHLDRPLDPAVPHPLNIRTGSPPGGDLLAGLRRGWWFSLMAGLGTATIALGLKSASATRERPAAELAKQRAPA